VIGLPVQVVFPSTGGTDDPRVAPVSAGRDREGLPCAQGAQVIDRESLQTNPALGVPPIHEECPRCDARRCQSPTFSTVLKRIGQELTAVSSDDHLLPSQNDSRGYSPAVDLKFDPSAVRVVMSRPSLRSLRDIEVFTRASGEGCACCVRLL